MLVSLGILTTKKQRHKKFWTKKLGTTTWWSHKGVSENADVYTAGFWSFLQGWESSRIKSAVQPEPLYLASWCLFSSVSVTICFKRSFRRQIHQTWKRTEQGGVLGNTVAGWMIGLFESMRSIRWVWETCWRHEVIVTWNEPSVSHCGVLKLVSFGFQSFWR